MEAKSSEVENLKQQNRRREEHFTTLLQETETRHSKNISDSFALLCGIQNVTLRTADDILSAEGQIARASVFSVAYFLYNG